MKKNILYRDCIFCASSTNILWSGNWSIPNLGIREIGISECTNCKAIVQSPSLSKEDMNLYYSNNGIYTNPGRKGKPILSKVRAVSEQIAFILRECGELPKSCIQIGSSDGYTLSRFKKEGVQNVQGIDLGTDAAKIAKDFYNIDTIIADIEEYDLKDSYELILLTHVLEHLYDPFEVLKKCFNSQKDGNLIYIEIPLCKKPNRLPVGFFSLEHINHFSREDILYLVEKVGYSIEATIEHNKTNIYSNLDYSPVIGVLASKDYQSNFKKNYISSTSFFAKEFYRVTNPRWKALESKIKDSVSQNQEVYIWGFGISTTLLFLNTDIEESYDIKGILDSSTIKHGMKMGNYSCMNVDDIEWSKDKTIIISSFAFEDEIYKSLANLMEKTGINVIRLYYEN